MNHQLRAGMHHWVYIWDVGLQAGFCIYWSTGWLWNTLVHVPFNGKTLHVATQVETSAPSDPHIDRGWRGVLLFHCFGLWWWW